MKRISIVLLLTIAAQIGFGFSNNPPVVQTEDVQVFKNEQTARLKQDEARIKQLKANNASLAGLSDEDYKRQISIIDTAVINLKKMLTTASYRNKESWEEFKRNYSHDIDELEKIIKDIYRDAPTNK